MRICLSLLTLLCPVLCFAAEPLQVRIDALIDAKLSSNEKSALSDDAEFLRRVYLDLNGTIPTVEEVRSFLAAKSPTKRQQKIDELLSRSAYATQMQQSFHVMFMERLGDNPAWTKWLHDSFQANKPWNQMAREILRADPRDEANRGAAFFYTKRLEKYGQNPTDYPGLTRDVGRLFLGKNLQCAECHDHLFVTDYSQLDFQGLFAFFQNTYLVDPKLPTLGEKPTTKKLDYMSVFKKVPKQTAPRIPGSIEISIPTFNKGEEYIEPPDRKKKTIGVLKFSVLESLAKQLPTAENPDFSKTFVNRLWFLMMGRGLVHPLDLHHEDNPPSHPELLDLLAKEFVAHNFDIKWMLRELALTQTYHRSSMLPEGQTKADPAKFGTMLEKRISAEQLLAAMLRATGQENNIPVDKRSAPQKEFEAAYANPPREPEEEVNPTLKAALYLLNGSTVLGWLDPKDGNLVARLDKMKDDNTLAEELYLSVLSRQPTDDERERVSTYLKKNAKRRSVALGHLVWALLASTEFNVNH